MNQSRRKSYLVLLAVAALGLVIDRFVFTGSATAPAEASAATVARPSVGRGAATGNARPSASIPEIPFPTGLVAAEALSTVPDVFAPPSVRLRGESGAGPPYNAGMGNGGRGPSERLSGAAFESRHTLVGVLVHQRRQVGLPMKMAVLDGRPVRIGDVIDGCTLKDVSGYRARFECHDGPAVLIVKDTGETGLPGGTRVPG